MLISSLKSPLEIVKGDVQKKQFNRSEEIELENRAQECLKEGNLEQALDYIRTLDTVHTLRQQIVGLSRPGEKPLHTLCCHLALKYAHQGDFGRALDLIPAESKPVFRNLILELIVWECLQRLQLINNHFSDPIQNLIIGYWIDVSDHDYGMKKRSVDKLTMVCQIAQSLLQDWSNQIAIGRKITFNARQQKPKAVIGQFFYAIRGDAKFTYYSVPEDKTKEYHAMIDFLCSEYSDTIRALRVYQWTEEHKNSLNRE